MEIIAAGRSGQHGEPGQQGDSGRDATTPGGTGGPGGPGGSAGTATSGGGGGTCVVKLSGTGPMDTSDQIEVRVQYEIIYNDGSLPGDAKEQIKIFTAGDTIKITARGGMPT